MWATMLMPQQLLPYHEWRQKLQVGPARQCQWLPLRQGGKQLGGEGSVYVGEAKLLEQVTAVLRRVHRRPRGGEGSEWMMAAVRYQHERFLQLAAVSHFHLRQQHAAVPRCEECAAPLIQHSSCLAVQLHLASRLELYTWHSHCGRPETSPRSFCAQQPRC